ncbi:MULTISPECIES: DUF397 domain-containing protein [unclassified Streptomyces]|uniref:DUF397 domain-containing protein n=1 Tax=unclassified Streptomyces TaxID=2593676 RepID=UPI000998D547|nr:MULTISPECIES: DUF397 domain-containing protein [unclassified Streptomyces]MYT32739.1 DUF397 domain-containing protein [Streptomyces sp. SID8354]
MKRVDVRDADWFKSSHSNGNGNCLEVAVLGEIVAARDSKQQSGPVVAIAADGWRAFISGVANGEFVRL